MRRGRQIALLVVCVLCMWCGSAFAGLRLVQLDDNKSLADIIQSYNYLNRRMNSDDFAQEMRDHISESFIQVDDQIVPYTKTYRTTNITTGTTIIACVNGNGYVSLMGVAVPISRSRAECVYTAAMLVQVIASDLPYKDIQGTCSNVMRTKEKGMVYSVKQNRGYVIDTDSSDNGYVLWIYAMVNE